MFILPEPRLFRTSPKKFKKSKTQVFIVVEFNSAGLGEHKIRDLNDEINKLIKEKEHWEERIKKLGGADYKKYGPRVLDKQGVELPGMKNGIFDQKEREDINISVLPRTCRESENYS